MNNVKKIKQACFLACLESFLLDKGIILEQECMIKVLLTKNLCTEEGVVFIGNEVEICKQFNIKCKEIPYEFPIKNQYTNGSLLIVTTIHQGHCFRFDHNPEEMKIVVMDPEIGSLQYLDQSFLENHGPKLFEIELMQKNEVNAIFPALATMSSEQRNEALGKLLERSWGVRNFEIDLYWKRATYFWIFIGASFSAYLLLFAKSDNSILQSHLPLLISCIGFIFSIAWYCVNRGSKYWQENWEAKITLIEEELDITLNNLQFKKEKNEADKKDFLGRRQFSVTRINSIVSIFICVIWAGIIIHHIPTACFSNIYYDRKVLLILAPTLIASIAILVQVDSIQKDLSHNFLL